MTMQRQPTSGVRPPDGLMSLSILQLLGVIWRRKLIIIVCLVVALSGAIVANGVITPRYTATASIIVEPRQQTVIEIESVSPSLPVSLETMQSEVQVIKSPTVARRVVDSLGLAALAEFNPSLAPREEGVVDEIKMAVKGVFAPVIAWLRDEPADRRGVELAQAPGTWDLSADELRAACVDAALWLLVFASDDATADNNNTALSLDGGEVLALVDEATAGRIAGLISDLEGFPLRAVRTPVPDLVALLDANDASLAVVLVGDSSLSGDR